MRRSLVRLPGLGILALAASLMLSGPAAAATLVVNDTNLGTDWFVAPQGAGSGGFVSGPGGPPIGAGSFQFATASGADGMTILTYNHVGTPLADVYGLGYCTYRDPSSTNPAVQIPSIQIEVDYVGDGSSYTTLVFEPVYTFGAGAIVAGSWQCWDAFGGGGAIWWSTRAIPGVPSAFDSFVPWSTIIASNPSAKIVELFGSKAGSGWNGQFLGNVDALSINDTTYDFEPRIFTKDDCKKGGWQTFTDPVFHNQGDCVSYFASGGS